MKLIEYIIYFIADPIESGHTGKIIGVVIMTIVVLAILISIVLYYRRRIDKMKSKSNDVVAYVPESSVASGKGEGGMSTYLSNMRFQQYKLHYWKTGILLILMYLYL